MANNRMLMVCNKCYPTDKDLWDTGPELWDNTVSIGKWYPLGSYSTKGNELLGSLINDYLNKHAHNEPMDQTDVLHNENPVRVTYETWVTDPKLLMSKWEMRNG